MKNFHKNTDLSVGSVDFQETVFFENVRWKFFTELEITLLVKISLLKELTTFFKCMAFNLSLPFISAEFFRHVTDFAHFHSSSVIMKDIWNLGIGIMLLYWKYIQTHSFSRYYFTGAKHLNLFVRSSSGGLFQALLPKCLSEIEIVSRKNSLE